jgi:6-pyruvoyltetrahydropterin/6-carboxytetrahydropterin synthase
MMDAKAPGVLYFSEKFEFAATHKLWNDAFSEERNFEIFGKCANPAGHGHNYLVEVTVATDADGPPLEVGEFEQIVDSYLMQLVDHKNLNLDVPEFRDRIATVENLAVFAWERLSGRFDPGRLYSITVWESDRTYCSYYGPVKCAALRRQSDPVAASGPSVGGPGGVQSGRLVRRDGRGGPAAVPGRRVGPEYKCYFGLARSRDGYHFERVSDQPVLSPSVEGFDGATIQDPRIIKMGDWYYVTYACRHYPFGQFWIPGGRDKYVTPAECPTASPATCGSTPRSPAWR